MGIEEAGHSFTTSNERVTIMFEKSGITMETMDGEELTLSNPELREILLALQGFAKPRRPRRPRRSLLPRSAIL